MGLLTSAMIGLGEGAKASAPFIKNMQEEDIQKLRDERLAELAKGAATFKAQTDLEYGPKQKLAEQAALAPGVVAAEEAKSRIAIEEAKAKPRTIPAGSTEKTGESTFTAPEKSPQAQLDYWTSLANLNNANADFVRGGGKDKEDKVIYPKLTAVEGADGKYLIDQNSGAIGRERPATPEKDSVWHLFSANEPAKPAVLAGMDWMTADGKPIQGGLASLYKQMNGGQGAGPEPQTGGFNVYAADIKAAQGDPELFKQLAGKIGGTDRLNTIIADYTKKNAAPTPTAPASTTGPSQGLLSKAMASTGDDALTFSDRQNLALAKLRKEEVVKSSPEYINLESQYKGLLRAGKTKDANGVLAQMNALRNK